MSKKKKKIKMLGGYQGWGIYEAYWGNFSKWLKLKRRGYIKWKKDLFKEQK